VADEEKLFRCEGCGRLVPWSEGASDDMPEHCDDCWALEHGCLHLPDPFPPMTRPEIRGDGFGSAYGGEEVAVWVIRAVLAESGGRLSDALGTRLIETLKVELEDAYRRGFNSGTMLEEP